MRASELKGWAQAMAEDPEFLKDMQDNLLKDNSFLKDLEDLESFV